jgi:hypothetical protein
MYATNNRIVPTSAAGVVKRQCRDRRTLARGVPHWIGLCALAQNYRNYRQRRDSSGAVMRSELS